MNHFQGFHSFAPSYDPSPKANQQQPSSFYNVHKFSIHIPQELLANTPSSVNQTQDNIKVYCRLKPSNKMQNSIKYDMSMIEDGQNRYSFDRVFSRLATQEEVYESIALRHVDDFLMGQNSTIFAYGQTGSGKTHTMFGEMRDRQNYGIIPRTLQEIFKKNLQDSSITCSMVEIYNEKMMDLLNPKDNTDIKLKEYKDGIVLEGLFEVSVENEEELMNIINLGHKSRKIATTFTNDVSSRSHTILFLYRNFQCESEDVKCKLCFIDLAGSEKVRKSGAQGQTLEEAKKINLSLSCLGNVIHALTNGSDYIPYRNSKLTRILKDSLGGDIKTSVVTTCSLDKCDYAETISTIKFAVRAKKIKNKEKLKVIDSCTQDKVGDLKKELAQVKEKYEEAQKQLAFYKKKDEMERYHTMDDIPQESTHYQPLKSLVISGGMSSRVRISQSCFKPF